MVFNFCPLDEILLKLIFLKYFVMVVMYFLMVKETVITLTG